tara:strand:- start:18689 stop:21457 length:2769 start_codon:yes stop_codon:yes gene_type:complete
MKKIIFIVLVIFNFNSIYSQIPLPEHPRPDFKRDQWQNLNGKWDFKFDPNNEGLSNSWFSGEKKFEDEIIVPFPWGSKLSGLTDNANIGWYSRDIKVSSKWKGKKIFITIGASDWETSLWIDGKFVGKHEGGYTPFSFELTPFLTYGKKHKIIVRVDDDAGDPNKFTRGHALYGKQGYGNARGIWQTVYLEARGSNYFDAIHFTPDIDNKSVNVKFYFHEKMKTNSIVKLNIKTDKGVINKKFTIRKGQLTSSFNVLIPNMRLWSINDPFLYQVEASLDDDRVESYFGMRKVSVVNLPNSEFPYVALNNKPIYLQFALDQSYHQDGFYTFPTDQFMKEEIIRSKSIGLNGIRIHIKTEIPRKLYWADKLGLLVVEDLPNSWGEPNKLMKAESEYTLRQMIKRDYNHPSIISWVIFNEQWGLKTKQVEINNEGPWENEGNVILPETFAWVASMYYLAKSLDQSRLIEDNSPCCGGLHTATDINSWHAYLPGYEWDEYLKDQTEKNYKGGTHLYYDGWSQQNQPFLNSECGNVWGYNGSTGDVDWSYDYHRMINSYRKYPEVSGWLYTEHHDVINEWNGYWKFDRSNKYTGLSDIMDGMTINDFHSPIYLSTGNKICITVDGDQKLKIPLFLSSMTDIDIGEKLKIEYELIHTNYIGESNEIVSNSFLINYKKWMNEEITPIEIRSPNVSGLSKLLIKVKSLNDKVLHRNFMHFNVFTDQKIPNVSVISKNPNEFSKSDWSIKTSDIMNGKKINGFGKGFFEYKFDLPKNLNNIKDAFFIVEASAKELFDKDKSDKEFTEDGLDYMKGSKLSPSKNPNSYPMTDEIKFPSDIDIYVNDKFYKTYDLEDDPADHRGILSWHNQPENRTLNEAGSYGYLIKLPLDLKKFKNGPIKIRMETKSTGGLALYGKYFGRYPINPSVVLIK